MNAHQIIEFDKARKEGKQLKITIPTSTDETCNILASVKREIEKPKAEFAKIKYICLDIMGRFSLFINLYQSRVVLRSRPNFNGEVFRRTADLIYNPKLDKLHLSRFNLERDLVFYCTDPVVSESFDATLTGISESCKELFDAKEKITTQYFTVSKFNVIKPMQVIILSHYEKAVNITLYTY